MVIRSDAKQVVTPMMTELFMIYNIINRRCRSLSACRCPRLRSLVGRTDSLLLRDFVCEPTETFRRSRTRHCVSIAAVRTFVDLCCSMELGNCLKCMKYSLFALNLLFWVSICVVRMYYYRVIDYYKITM